MRNAVVAELLRYALQDEPRFAHGWRADYDGERVLALSQMPPAKAGPQAKSLHPVADSTYCAEQHTPGRRRQSSNYKEAQTQWHVEFRVEWHKHFRENLDRHVSRLSKGDLTFRDNNQVGKRAAFEGISLVAARECSIPAARLGRGACRRQLQVVPLPRRGD